MDQRDVENARRLSHWGSFIKEEGAELDRSVRSDLADDSRLHCGCRKGRRSKESMSHAMQPKRKLRLRLLDFVSYVAYRKLNVTRDYAWTIAMIQEISGAGSVRIVIKQWVA